MKSLKLKKTDLKKGYEHILKIAGAISKDGTTAFPSHVYMSKKDSDLIDKLEIKELIKDGLTKEEAIKRVAFYSFNLGPSCVLEDAIAEGFLVVDTASLEAEKKQHGKN